MSWGVMRVVGLGLICFLLLSAGALLLLPVGAVTFFRARRVYAAAATRLARSVLWVWGVQVVVEHDRPFPREQVVYVSNHTSTLDLFVLVALGLPRTRFFLSGFVRKFVPVGIIAHLMGTFFTVPQDRPAERIRIFRRADRILRRTRESVYLSPEGGRVVTGNIGRFNKGAFHLATSLKAPIVPMYLHIPPEIDPGLGYNARSGRVHVYVKPPIFTRDWRLEDLVLNKERVHEMFVQWNLELRRRPHGEPSDASADVPVVLAAR